MRFVLAALVAFLTAGSVVTAQQVDRSGVLQAALRSALRERFGWGPPTVGVVAARTSPACDGVSCPGEEFIVGTTLPPPVRAYAHDPLATRVVERPEAAYRPTCVAGKSPSYLKLAEPTIHGDTAYVGVEWHSCVPRPERRDSVQQAIFVLQHVKGKWQLRSVKAYPLCNPPPFSGAVDQAGSRRTAP